MQKSIILYIFLELVFIIGCNINGLDCGVLSTAIPTVGTIEARMVQYLEYNNVLPIEELDTVAKDELAIWMDVEPYYISENETGYQSLMACSPAYALLDNEILGIKIVSSLDLNDTIPAGTDVTNYFGFKTLQSEEPVANLSLLNAYFQSDYYFFLVPMIQISPAQYLQFDIQLILNDNQVFDLTSNKVFGR